MQLLTKEIIDWLPGLYETEAEEDPIAWVKFFTPHSYWTWYILEGQKQDDGDWLFFAHVEGMAKTASPEVMRDALNSLNFARVSLGGEEHLIRTKTPGLANRILRLLE